MGRVKSVLIMLAVVTLFLGCRDKDGRMPTSLLPLSVAAPGEIFISMDSVQWHGEVGKKIRSILNTEVEGLPREEYLFTLRYISPQNFSATLRQVSNIIYVTTWDVKSRGARIIQGYFPEESQQKIMSNANYFLTTAKDVYARDQEIMYLFGQSEESLLSNLEENSQTIVDHFNRIERQRIESDLFAKLEKGISNAIGREMNVRLKIPIGYQMAMLRKDFAWMVFQDNKVDKHIFISHTPYYDISQFENESIIERRDKVGKKYIYEDQDNFPDSWLVTEQEVPYIPVKSRQINLNGKFAVETRGLWRTNNRTMGGPFIGVSVVDEKANRLYYIEGFIFSPGESQREFIREMEAIIHTFRTSEELAG